MLGSSRTNGWYFVYQSGVSLWYTQPVYIKRLTILIYLLVKVGKLCLLKSATQFYSGLDGASFLHKSVAHAFEIEGGVIFVSALRTQKSICPRPFWKLMRPFSVP